MVDLELGEGDVTLDLGILTNINTQYSWAPRVLQRGKSVHAAGWGKLEQPEAPLPRFTNQD